ncbi:MAG: hypothetical protein ACO3JL_03280, partial [Myxococcota bacterium]
YAPALVVALALGGCSRDTAAPLDDADAKDGRLEKVSLSEQGGTREEEVDAGGAPLPLEPTPEGAGESWDELERSDDDAPPSVADGLDDDPFDDDTDAPRPRGSKYPPRPAPSDEGWTGWCAGPLPLTPLPSMVPGIPGSSSLLEQELGITGPFTGRTTVVLRDVELALANDVTVEVERLTGILQGLPSPVVNLDNPATTELHVREGVVSLGERDVARLLAVALEEQPWSSTPWVDDTDDEGWQDVGARFVDGQFAFSAELPRGGRIEVKGYLEATPQGALRLVPLQLEREGRRASSVHDLFGDDDLEVPFTLGRRSDDGSPELIVAEEGLYFDVGALSREPKIFARVVDVTLEAGRLRLLLEGAAPRVRMLSPPDAPSGYLWLRGGPVRFGRLTMARSDLLFVPFGPQERLVLSLVEYQRQLLGGQLLWRADLGLTLQLPAMGASTDDDDAMVP